MRTLLLLFLYFAVTQTKYISSDESSMVRTLTEQELKQLFSEEPIVVGGETQVKPWKDQDGSRRHGGHRGRHGHRRDFQKENCTRKFKKAEESLLSGLETDEKKEFYSIRMDDSLTRNQKRSKLNVWATKYGKESELIVNLEKKQQWKKEKSEELDTVIDTLGDKIRAIQEIVDDDDLVMSEQKEQIGAILKDSSESVVRILNSIYPQYQKRSKRSYHPDHHQRDHHHQRHPEHHPHGRHYRSINEENDVISE